MPHQLRTLARMAGPVELTVVPPVTLGRVLDALETAHPALTGTVRDRHDSRRRPMIRIHAAGEDLSDAAPGTRDRLLTA